MTINYRLISDEATYDSERYTFIKNAEEHGRVQLQVYDDGSGNATIGIGINLKVATNNKAVTEVLLGINYTRARAITINNIIKSHSEMTVQAALDAQMQEWAKTTPGMLHTHYTFNDEAEVKKAFNIIAVSYENNLTSKITVEKSEERIALFSLNYNSSSKLPLIGDNLVTDLGDGNRAEAWYEIRYQSNGGKDRNGTALRRYYEADRFGLYNDSANVTADDAKQVAQMYTTHRAVILSYENNVQHPYYNPKAAAMGWAALSIPTTIQDIYHELQSAITELKKEYYVAPTLLIDEVQMVTDKIVKLNGADGTGKVHNSLLIGSDGKKIIIHGGPGNDAIVGLGSNDMLYGGAGDDYFYLEAQTGTATVDGGTGVNTIDFSQQTNPIDILFTGTSPNGNTSTKYTAGIKNIQKIVGTSGNDTFELKQISGVMIDGGAGTNTIDFSQDIRPVTLDMGSGKEGTNTFTHIQDFVGTKFADTFIAGNASVTMQGGAGNDVYLYDRMFNPYTGTRTHNAASDTIIDSDGKFLVNMVVVFDHVYSHANDPYLPPGQIWYFTVGSYDQLAEEVIYDPSVDKAYLYTANALQSHFTVPDITVNGVGGDFKVSLAKGGEIQFSYTPVTPTSAGANATTPAALAQLHLFNQYMAAGFHGSDAGALSGNVEAVQIEHLATLAAAHTHMHGSLA